MLHTGPWRLASSIAAVGFALLASTVPANAATTHPASAPSPATAAAEQAASTAIAALKHSHAATASPDTYPPAYISRTQFLTNNPNSTLPASCTPVRTILLRAGNYNFWEFVGGTVMAANDNIFVPAGNYIWDACLVPQNGTYDESAAFADSNGNIIAALDHVLVLATSGTWTWGSGLDLIQIN
jgi:hypothetical protein